MVASIEKASGKAYCRGQCGWNQKIPKDTKCLVVSIRAAGGGASAYYCEKCMKKVIESFIQAINDCGKDVEDL